MIFLIKSSMQICKTTLYKKARKCTRIFLAAQELEALMMAKEAEVEEMKSSLLLNQSGTSAEIKALTDELERLRAENEALKEEIDVLKAERQRQSEVIARLSAASSSGSDEVTKLRDENRSLTEAKLRFEIENSNLRDKLSEREKQIDNLKTTIQNLNKENQQLVDNVTKTQTSTSGDLAGAQRRVEKLEASLERANDERDAAKRALLEREKALATDFISHEQLKLTLQNAETQLDKCTKEVNNLTEENAQLKQDSAKKSSDVEKLMLKVVELNERSENSTITLTSMADLVKEKQSHIDDLRNEIQTLKSTNNNFFNKLEDVTTSRQHEQDVIKSKYEDMEAAHRKLLDENKRLRTVLAHKNMSETNQDSEKQALHDKLFETERELNDANERIQHLEAMLDDVYKAREITGSKQSRHTAFADDDVMSQKAFESLPELQGYARNERNKKTQPQLTHQLRNDNSSDQRQSLQAKTSSSGRSWELRKYRHATGYSKRFESRPSKARTSGVITQLR